MNRKIVLILLGFLLVLSACAPKAGTTSLTQAVNSQATAKTLKIAVLPIIEEDYSALPDGLPQICGYEAKWEQADVRYAGTVGVCPAPLGPEVRSRLEHDLDLVVDGGFCGLEPTTVVELEDGQASVARPGKGDNARFTV